MNLYATHDGTRDNIAILRLAIEERSCLHKVMLPNVFMLPNNVMVLAIERTSCQHKVTPPNIVDPNNDNNGESLSNTPTYGSSLTININPNPEPKDAEDIEGENGEISDGDNSLMVAIYGTLFHLELGEIFCQIFHTFRISVS
jgi:hypothetical protein